MKENELKNEKSVDVLSVRYLEFQSIILPQDIFRNDLTWQCYEIYKSLEFYTWSLLLLLLCLTLGVWWRMFTDWILLFIVSLFVLFKGLTSLPAIHALFRKRSLSKQLSQFCKEITKNTPGMDTYDWEVVAKNLNTYLYANKAWNTRYFFFDAADCREAFRTTLLEPFSLKKDETAKVKSFKDSVPYIEEALGVYFTEVEKKWKLFNTEKSWSPVGLEDAKLPKEAHRLKFTWVLKRIFTIYSFSSFFPSLYNVCDYRLLFRIWKEGLLRMSIRHFRNLRVSLMKMEHKMQFLSIIINEQESGANGWDAIAMKTNRYLFEKKVWKNEEFFYDGIDCERFFNHNFYSLLFSKKRTPTKSLNVELWPYIKEAQSVMTSL
ncbi:HLJ1_G0054580.mRNA.1.CDS.1 [Saccharomyces cerevisiae]|nr:HLJ1_G0054580.mRNA.1.CDS.1 [Saccharomyces cerevisiae]